VYMRLSGTAGPAKEVLRNIQVAALFEALVEAQDEPEVAAKLLAESSPALLHPYRSQAQSPRVAVRTMLALENERLDLAAASYTGKQGERALAARRQMREFVLKELDASN
jgi:hypothetical protein